MMIGLKKTRFDSHIKARFLYLVLALLSQKNHGI